MLVFSCLILPQKLRYPGKSRAHEILLSQEGIQLCLQSLFIVSTNATRGVEIRAFYMQEFHDVAANILLGVQPFTEYY